MKTIGLIINPIAGMGGRVGLKGSDGSEIQKAARELGAVPEAQEKAGICLKDIDPGKVATLLAGPGEMGEGCAELAGFSPQAVGNITPGGTTAKDTIEIARQMVQSGIDLLLFTGGDGTARNIYDAVGLDVPVLGIPAGVKIHSAVYALNPKNAGKAVNHFLSGKSIQTRSAEVMDLDEDLFRTGSVKAKLYGYMTTPEAGAYIQNVKSGGYSEKEAILGMAAEVTENMDKDTTYIIGPGTTTRSTMERMELKNTLIGVDVIRNGKVVANDVNENQLHDLVKNAKAKIIVTVIGGQGHIFGRGNQQISPRIIRKIGKENIIVVATKEKLISLRNAPLIVDTSDPDLDKMLSGYIRVVTGFEDYVPCKVSA